MWQIQQARPEQLEPDGDWDVWFYLAGRGSGKTRSAAEWLAYKAVANKNTRWAVIAPTFSDVRDTCFEGESGLIAILNRYGAVKTYNRSMLQLTLNNESIIKGFSAEEPERLRGPQFHGSWCFIAGTLIDTPSGRVPIERLGVGDCVWSSSGVASVVATGCREAELWCLEFEGGSLVGSAEHPIWTDRGWVELQFVTPSDTIYAWSDDGISVRQDTLLPTKTVECCGSTGLCGKKPTGRFLKGNKFITSTVSKMTTGWKTWCASLPKSTVANTISQGILSHVKSVALSVKSLFMRERPDSANRASCDARSANGGATKSCARGAETPSSHGLQSIAVKNVSTLGVAGKVYNLTVDNSHDYFANRILVHNCDELAAYKSPRDIWDQLQFTLRLGKHPQTFITTTPKPIPLIRELIGRGDETVVVTRGSTYDNRDNLAPSALREFAARYEGTRLGRQELHAEILEDIEGALWSGDLIDVARVSALPFDKIVRRVISVDPAVTATGDETGIVVMCRDRDGHGYVEADLSMQGTPNEWAKRVCDAFDNFDCDAVVVEVNQGGELVTQTLRTVNPHLPIREVRASKGKRLRAEPISALYEQGRVHHVGVFEKLELQMTTWTPDEQGSPDRLDALVHGMTDLMKYGGAEAYLREIALICVCGFPSVRGVETCAKCGAVLKAG